MSEVCPLGRPDFLADSPVTFLWFFGVCDPEEDVAKGGRQTVVTSLFKKYF